MKTNYVKIKLIESDGKDILCVIRFDIELNLKTKKKIIDIMRQAGNRYIFELLNTPELV